MDNLTMTECRTLNKAKLLLSDLWIAGDGTSFPPTLSGHGFAAKHARKNGLVLCYVKKIKSKPISTKGKNSHNKKN